MKKTFLLAAFAFAVGAAILFASQQKHAGNGSAKRKTRPGFVATEGARLVVDGQAFRFVGANVAVIYGDEERANMPEALRQAARDGAGVVRVWASGESGGGDADNNDWIRVHPFRRGPDEWNEEAFVNLDRVLVEAAKNNLRVQICLANWWRDTGGVVQYLRWAGVDDAVDESKIGGIDTTRALAFYTNAETRRLYRAHVERIVARRNTLTGVLYRDDPAIMSYELMNEAQCVTGRFAERRAWIAEMSAYLKSLDADHLIAPGTWGYRTSWERREWLQDHRLETVDFCDVHVYPKDDADSFVDSPETLRAFLDNRAAAAFSLNKPLVIGEFGMTREGYNGVSQAAWFESYFKSAAQASIGGAMFWRMTHDPSDRYGVTYQTPRDEGVRAEMARGAQLFASLRNAAPPASLLTPGKHLVPRQFAFTRAANDETARPEIKKLDQGGILYQFKPEMAASGRFERLGGGDGYIWGTGVGRFEYIVPARDDYRQVRSLNVRAHLQPVAPVDARPSDIATRVTLFINGTDCGSRLVSMENSAHNEAIVQEWRVDLYRVRLQAMRGHALSIVFAVKADADQPFGLNISNWPRGYDAHGAKPVEVEVR